MMRLPTVALLAAALALLSLGREADAGARRSRPLQTGLTFCSDADGTAIPCTSTGQDGDLRRGEPRAYIDNGNGTIKDNRTALTWEKLSSDGTVHDKDDEFTWAQAFVKIGALNTPPCFAGFCDWRLPNIMELQTLANFGTALPAISAPFQIGCSPGCTVLTGSCTKSEFYWSSSAAALNPLFAYCVDFSDGRTFGQPKVIDYGRVRAVRGGS